MLDRVFLDGKGQVPLETARPKALRARSLTGQARCYDRRNFNSLLKSFINRRGSGSCSTGQAALSLVLLVSGVVLEIAVAGSLVAYFLNTAGFGERLSARAFAAAAAGMEDATLQLVRNKEFVTTGPVTYTFSVGSDSVSVLVSRVVDNAAGTYVYAVTATGVAGSRERQLLGRVVVDQANGLVRVQSIAEQSVD